MADKDREQKKTEFEHEQQPRGRTSDELNGTAVVTKGEGRKLGSVQDLLLDPNTMSIAGVVVSKGGLLDQDTSIVPANEVDAWGEDAILVSSPEVLKREDEFPEREKWLSVSNKVKGRSIVSSEGKRIGQLNDVLVDNNGQIIAYRVSEGMFGETKEISAEATETFGEDVLIVDMNR